VSESDLLDPWPSDAERASEGSLRPRKLEEFVGQARIREQLGIVLESARRRGLPPDHLLFSGPPGLGKTSLAAIVAAELGVGFRVTSGPALERAGDLAAILTGLEPGDVLFVDEIHRLPRAVEEVLYPAMEDFQIDVVLGKGPGARSLRLDLPRFTLVSATTRTGLITSPLRDRFGFSARLDYYGPADLQSIVTRSAAILGVTIDAAGAEILARRSRGTPRIANRLLRRVRDYAEVRADGAVDEAVAEAALELFEVDRLGLDKLDLALLRVLCERFGGAPVGLATLAVSVGEEQDTVEDVAEPYLLQLGFLQRTPRGRVATAAAFAHLGLEEPRGPGAAPAPGSLFEPEGSGEPRRGAPVGREGSGEPRRGAPVDREVTRDGRIYELAISALPDRQRQSGGHLVVARDVTERRQVEEQLCAALNHERVATDRLAAALAGEQAAAEHLRNLDEAKSGFLQAVSHDLRTPLASVLGISLTLQRGRGQLGPADTDDLLGRLTANARKLDRILTGLLDLDRLDRGIVELRRERVDLARLVAGVVSEAREELLDGHPVSLELLPVQVVADAAKVERIVENLLANAARHTDPGTPIWVRVTHGERGALLCVDDAGPGVPAEQRESIFRPFERGPGGDSYTPGSGVGLALVAQIASLHDGHAWVEDRAGGGASFRVLLPEPNGDR